MKIKFILIIITLITFTGGIYDGLRNQSKASNHTSNKAVEVANASLSDLMSSMNIYQIEKPVASPEFSLGSLDGEQINLRDFNGKVVLLSFWATW
jgi:hypothetical protein